MAIMQQHASKDLGMFFSQWLLRPGRIDASYEWTYDSRRKRLQLTIVQKGDAAYQFPLEILLSDQEKKVRKQIDVQKGVGAWSFRLKFRPDELLVDPEGKLLATFRTRK